MAALFQDGQRVLGSGGDRGFSAAKRRRSRRRGSTLRRVNVTGTVLLPKTSSVLLKPMHGVRPMVAGGGAHATGERCGMVIDRAAATGLSRCDERVRAAAASAGEQQGQRRGDPRAAPPA